MLVCQKISYKSAIFAEQAPAQLWKKYIVNSNKRETISGFGRYPTTQAVIHTVQAQTAIYPILATTPLIPRGMGLSYGDSAVASHVLSMRKFNFFLAFDEENGILHCESGVTIADIMEVFVPRGWFVPVTPGTKFVTIGGAIASDVHGKNHHHFGAFSESVIALELMLPCGKIQWCCRQTNVALFYATCAGMGLTGIILSAKIQLQRIPSVYMQQTTIQASCLEEILELFETYQEASYSVAWLDCNVRGKKLGRSLLMLGEYIAHASNVLPRKNIRSIPFDLPAFFLNRQTVSLFNTAYYHRVRRKMSYQVLDINEFFYPLDSLLNWNRLYGKAGFLQYQFVLPKAAGVTGLKIILQKISEFGQGAFLTTLKLLGNANPNWLSFPKAGYTLALDFKMSPKLLTFLQELDAVVQHHAGSIYLTKDARLSRSQFDRFYPQADAFRELRQHLGAGKCLQSLQSQRLAL